MKRHAFFLTLFSIFYFSVSAQVDSFQKDIIDCLKINGTYEESNMAYNRIFSSLKRQFEVSNVPENVWTDMQKDRDTKIQEHLSFIAYAYRRHFTHEEILAMKAFYETDAGKGSVGNPGGLTDAQNNEIKAFFSSPVGKKIEKTRAALEADIKDITLEWRTEVFGGTMQKLVKMGYYTKY